MWGLSELNVLYRSHVQEAHPLCIFTLHLYEGVSGIHSHPTPSPSAPAILLAHLGFKTQLSCLFPGSVCLPTYPIFSFCIIHAIFRFSSVDIRNIYWVLLWDFPGGSDGKASVYNEETLVRSLGGEDLLEKEMATHSGILARKIPRMEEPGRLQSMGPQSRTQLSNFTFTFTVCQALGIQLTSFSWIYYLTPSFFFSSFLLACLLSSHSD